MQLSSLARLTHERHFNVKKFRRDELYIPGGLVIGLTLSSSGKDLHEVRLAKQTTGAMIASDSLLGFTGGGDNWFGLAME